MIESRRADGMVYFDFACEGCGAQGELGIDPKDGTKPFGCPEGCGATYIPWLYCEKFKLTCVVCPVGLDQ